MLETALSAQEQGRDGLAAWQAAAAANAFETDAFFQRLVRRCAGPNAATLAARLREVAHSAGTELDRAVRESNRDENLPVVRSHDAQGQPTAEVVFHPDYHVAGRVFWASGVLSVLADPGNEVTSGALAYLLDQHGEAGHACPVACTAGAIKLIRKVGSADQKDRFLPALLASDYDRRLHAAQFITEVQGGSDVGLNACVAEPDLGRPGSWRISGEKWFCSVADAGLFVVSARPAGAPAGTRGLGLFLVPRLVDGRPNGFRLRRLKVKLGTRSMATGEIEFDGALAEAIGPLDGGFKNLVGIVLDTSRVHNALAACGIMRRAFVEGLCFARSRRAFEQPIVEFPAVQETLARMKARTMAALASTFRVLDMTDRLDRGAGGADLQSARRIAVMINKYWTALAATASARDGIELLGGNGTIEELSVLPRLYRDAIVVESWEGTHNTLCAQVLRDFAARGLHRPWLELLGREIAALDATGAPRHAARARELHADTTGRIERLLASEPRVAAAHVRHVVDAMCRLTEWVALASQSAWERATGEEGDTAAALDLYAATWLDRVDPQATPGLGELHLQLAATT